MYCLIYTYSMFHKSKIELFSNGMLFYWLNMLPVPNRIQFAEIP